MTAQRTCRYVLCACYIFRRRRALSKSRPGEALVRLRNSCCSHGRGRDGLKGAALNSRRSQSISDGLTFPAVYRRSARSVAAARVLRNRAVRGCARLVRTLRNRVFVLVPLSAREQQLELCAFHCAQFKLRFEGGWHADG